MTTKHSNWQSALVEFLSTLTEFVKTANEVLKIAKEKIQEDRRRGALSPSLISFNLNQEQYLCFIVRSANALPLCTTR